MAALLIREGFITVEDLYLHVSWVDNSSDQTILIFGQITPTDEGMNELHKKYLASIRTSITGSQVNQLVLAAPLPPAPEKRGVRPTPMTWLTPAPAPATTAEVKKAPEPKIPKQKVGLIHALFAVGALRPAFALLSKFRWMVGVFPEIADVVLRAVKCSFQPVWNQMYPPKAGTASFSRPRARYSSSGIVTPERRPQLTLWAPTPACSSTAEFVFFFPKWTERVPKCSSVQDLVDVMEPMLKFVGLYTSRDPQFLIKLTKVGKTVLQDMVCILVSLKYVERLLIFHKD